MVDYHFPSEEEKIAFLWQKEETFKKSIDPATHPEGEFIFYEGPPTANGKPGVHHVLARAFKDAIPRFESMRGKVVRRKAGWDTHGLPVELAVEKKLHISGKQDIENIRTTIRDSIAYFNNECRSSVWEYKNLWEKLTTRMGYWVDMEHPYVTYDNDYINSVWSILKKIASVKVHGEKILYKDFRVSPYCYSCGTALSSHEVAQGYKEVYDTSVTISFVIEEGKGCVHKGDRILVWTTTPWTLPGNVALAVGSEINYARVKGVDGTYYIVAEELLPKIAQFFPVLGQHNLIDTIIKGKELEGVKYTPLFHCEISSDCEKSFRIYIADFVTTTDGTGIVHIAPMYGEDDFNLGSKEKLLKVHIVGSNGTYIPASYLKDIAYQSLIGQKVKDKETEKEILKILEARNITAYTEVYRHSYPHCWRCSNPLIYYAMPSWFLRMSSFQKKLIDLNAQITWFPSHIKDGRFGEWIRNVKDWAISRSRYWGTPLPIWCAKDNPDDFQVWTREDLRQRGVSDEALSDLHRPFLDEIEVYENGKVYTRVPEVLDVWFDSGAMPWAQEGLNAIDTATPPRYPADYIAEAIDQTRGWFYTLIAIAAMTDQKKPPFLSVTCLGHINDAKGQKMSKSKGNIVDPFYLFDIYGADAVRWYLYTVNAPGESKNFDEKEIKKVISNTFLIAYNILTFWELYPSPPERRGQPVISHILDLWQTASTKKVIASMTSAMENKDLYAAATQWETYVHQTSTWFLRRSRERIKEGDLNARFVLRESISTMALLAAPLAPFFSETLFRRVTLKDASVHLQRWPTFQEFTFEEDKVLHDMEKLRELITTGLAYRAEHNIKIRQPLPSATVYGMQVTPELEEIIIDELNVKKVLYEPERTDGVKLTLDTALSPELIREGLARELVRVINAERKVCGLRITDNVPARFHTDNEVLAEILESGVLNSKTLVTQFIREKEIKDVTPREVQDSLITFRFDASSKK